MKASNWTVYDACTDFFERNPDEALTCEDIAVKFDCSMKSAAAVMRCLRRDGIKDECLPSVKRGTSIVNPALFPDNLTPSEMRAVQAYYTHWHMQRAADSLGITYFTIGGYLKAARRKAAAGSTKELMAIHHRICAERAKKAA